MIIKLKENTGLDIYINIEYIVCFNKNENSLYTSDTAIKLKCGSLVFVEDTPEQIEEKINCSILRLEEEKAKINKRYRM